MGSKRQKIEEKIGSVGSTTEVERSADNPIEEETICRVPCRGELAIGKSSLLVEKMHCDRSKLVISKLPLSQVLREMKEEKVELVIGNGKKYSAEELIGKE